MNQNIQETILSEDLKEVVDEKLAEPVVADKPFSVKNSREQNLASAGYNGIQIGHVFPNLQYRDAILAGRAVNRNRDYPAFEAIDGEERDFVQGVVTKLSSIEEEVERSAKDHSEGIVGEDDLALGVEGRWGLDRDEFVPYAALIFDHTEGYQIAPIEGNHSDVYIEVPSEGNSNGRNMEEAVYWDEDGEAVIR
ncbi:MAG: hypothetical protein ABEJ56_03100 [Candidatus Nanohaloarchaea archaeon]